MKKFLGIASTSDLEAIRKEMECTRIVNGVHVCTNPRYEKTIKPSDIATTKWNENFCIAITHLPEVSGIGPLTDGMSASVEHRDIPDNYICIEGKKARQYFQGVATPAASAALESIRSRTQNGDATVR